MTIVFRSIQEWILYNRLPFGSSKCPLLREKMKKILKNYLLYKTLNKKQKIKKLAKTREKN